ncbi:MAG: hypothetical protein R3F13_19445 [Prosthecobacter sp.]
MKAEKHIPDPTEMLPGEADFDPFGGCLDAQHAWREFGGLSIDQAYSKFIEHPMCYQEDFMFMGGRAFLFYFPVIERYLREYRVGSGPGEVGDSYAAIIAAGLMTQFMSPTAPYLAPIYQRVVDLSHHVRGRIAELAADTDEQQNIDSNWQILQAQIIR